MSFNQLHVLQCHSGGVPETQPLVSKGCQNKVALFGHPTRALSNVILHCRLWLCVLSLSLACGLEGIELAFVCQMPLGQMGKVLPLQVHVCKPMFGWAMVIIQGGKIVHINVQHAATKIVQHAIHCAHGDDHQ